MKHFAAKTISYLFNPLLVIGAMLIIFYTKLPGSERFFGGGLLMIVFVLIFLIYGMRKKWFSDLEVTKRHERHLFNLFVLSLGIPLFFLTSSAVFWYYTIFYVWFVLFSSITLFWKISGHTGIFTLVLVLTNHITQGQFTFLYIFVPLVAWSRVVLKKHTLAQTVGGVSMSIIFGIGGIQLFIS